MRGEHVVGKGKGEVVPLPAPQKGARPAGASKPGLTFGEVPNMGNPGGPPPATGTSIFDPTLCELIYRWFCPPAGLVLDPFAGGSVRGIVASRLGRPYVGVELRPEQVAANGEQAAAICGEPMPRWIEGDARQVAGLCERVAADLIFTCPPYLWLERYSEDARDLSTALPQNCL